MKYIKEFKDISIKDIALVGGKNASLGEMISQLSAQEIPIPNGFAVTSEAYWHFITANGILEELKALITNLDYKNINQLQATSSKIRTLIEAQPIPEDLKKEIIAGYQNLSRNYNTENLGVAVRSSATAEDLPTASFAGQQESFLNVQGLSELLESYKKCVSSLFTPRAIVYRIENNFDHFKVALSVGVQKMIRSDLACAGVTFTLDPETGFKDVVFINSSWGLGESVVSGSVDPDGFYVHKPTLEKGFRPILKKYLGTKKTKVIYTNNYTKTIDTQDELRNKFTLNNNEILELATMAIIIEQYYSKINSKWTPMDIEWAKDGAENKLYIVQARPETIHNKQQNKNVYTKYLLKNTSSKKIICTGQSIGQKIVSGTARVILNPKQINEVKAGDILITSMTDPDWVPIMKLAAAIITDQGGRTCHAAIVSRELGIPAIIGTHNATSLIKTGQKITLDCSQGQNGNIYDGEISFETKTYELSELKKLPCKLLINCGIPEQAFEQSFLPVDGVGLARLEFIITNNIKIHPMALIHFDRVKDLEVKEKIDKLTAPYESKEIFFIDSLAQEAGMIAAAFYPRPVVIRFSDFKSNEYRNLIGGQYFEPEEENPMMGLRGACRYYNDIYKDAFALELAAINKIYNEMGLTNIKVMVPFVRTTKEAKIVLDLIHKHIPNAPEILMMCEIPSNVILIDEFSKLFEGFSIGSNDLTQFTLAADRDSAVLAESFNETNEAVKIMLKMAIDGAKRNNKPIGICGQAPSDYPELAKFLIDCRINSISLNPDTVLEFLTNYKESN
ncbi:MAG: phosphoenolpyruvate synthase [Candidatus Babeliales bacterium]|nr:phosphoenolpyruvate synthase [Candidatus Babeliales bacterium]